MKNLLKQGLRRLTGAEVRRPRGPRNATVIAISAFKGGVGKTTTAVNLAAALARFHSARVLLIDLDPQGNVRSALHTMVQHGGRPLSDVLDADRGLELMDIAVATSIEGLDVSGPDDQLAAAEARLTGRIGKEVVLRDALKITRTYYDYIIFDCAPSRGDLTISALAAADQVILPCDPSPLAVEAVSVLAKVIATVAERLHPEIDVLGILVTRVDGRTHAFNQEVVQGLHDAFGDAVLPMHIGVSASLAKAQRVGEDVFAYDPGSRGATHYRALADYVVACCPPVKQSMRSSP